MLFRGGLGGEWVMGKKNKNLARSLVAKEVPFTCGILSIGRF